MATELELLHTSISHFNEEIKELRMCHQWCQSMKEAVEKSFIPIPRIDLNKINEQIDLSLNVDIFKTSIEFSTLLNANSNTNILWNCNNFLKFSFKKATEINILDAYTKIINNNYDATKTTIKLSACSSGLLLNVFKHKDHSFISINISILTNLSNSEYNYNLLKFDFNNNNFQTLLGCNYYDVRLAKTYGDSPKDGFEDMSLIKSYWLPLNIDSYSNSFEDKFNIIANKTLKYVTTGELESNPTENDINSSIWLPYQISLYYQMYKKYADKDNFLKNSQNYPIGILERAECRTVLNFASNKYIFFNMMPNSRCIRTVNINNNNIPTKYDFLDYDNIIKPLVNGEIILIQETKPNDISEVFFKY